MRGWAYCRLGGHISQNKIKSLKPGVSRSVHLFAAPFLWTAIGTLLMVRGFNWIGAGMPRWLVLLALLLGTVKSLLVLDKTAKKSLQRIMELDDNTCIGAVYSWKTWLLVAMMMTFGITMRRLTDPGMVIGTLYMAIGWALFLSSRHGWIQWLQWIRRD
jgi:xanthine/uracil permease